MAITDVASFGAIRERIYPLVAGLVAGATCFAGAPTFFCYAQSQNWKIGEIYVAGFEFSAVATSFLFTFYTFVVTADRGFIARMRNSIYFADLITFTVRALILGTVLAIVSVPMMVMEPAPLTRWGFEAAEVTAWVFLAAWTLAAFVRTTRLFIAFAAADH